MSPVAEKLSDAEIRELAAYYAALPPFASRRAADPARAAAGKKLSDAQHCGSCHLADLSGQKHIPRLVGQQHEYLLKEMRAFKDQTRADLDGSMTMAAQPLSPRDIEDVAEYISSLAPAAPSGLTVTAVDPNDIELSWQVNSSDQTGFEISNGVTTASGRWSKSWFAMPGL